MHRGSWSSESASWKPSCGRWSVSPTPVSDWAGLSSPRPRCSAARSGRALVRLAPYRESGYRLLMQVLAAEGNVAEATAVYATLCSRLREELGRAPAADIRDLHRRLIAP